MGNDVTRSLLEVIDAMVAEIPKDEDSLLTTLASIRRSAEFAAPEIMGHWWNKCGMALESGVGPPNGIPWKVAVERMFSGRAHELEPAAVASGLGVADDPSSARPAVPLETVQGDSAPNPDQDIVACQDCAEPAEFVTFSDPPLAKCFRCAILKAMNRFCALCGKQPVECIVRAVGENQRQDIIGVCANCFSKRLSGMRN